MRLLSRLLIVLVFCLVAIALPAAPAQAYGEKITLSPDDGVPGEEVTIYGYNFTAYADVAIYYYPNGDEEEWIDEVSARSDGSFRFTFDIPESCTGKHKVFAEDEYDIDAYADFTVEPGLTVSPEEGPVGTTVTVEGHGFAEDEENIELWYDDEVIEDDIPADEYGSWEWSFQIPASAQGNHDIDADGDESQYHEVKNATFKVTPGISLNESSGSVGDTITMTGNGFKAAERDIKILFEGEEAETEPEIIRADAMGYWQAIFQVPEMPTDEYSVTAEGERTPKEDITPRTFKIEPGIVLSPDEGYVDMNLTVTGHGFAANKDVVIKYDDSQKATATTNAKGSFSGASFLVTEGIHGPHEVTAEDAAANEATAIFTMESNKPPIPALISPPNGGRVGFIGKERPTFEWSEVPDDSGVRYRLQIATSANVTATGFVDDPVFSIEGLVETSYTLNETALDYGTYYWIVRAVDRAGNEGNWTVAYSFRVGVLPLWAFIVIIVAIVAGIGAAVYFFVIRKRIYYY